MANENEMPTGGLILERKVGDTFNLVVDGTVIQIELMRSTRSSARLRIIAPKKVLIHRDKYVERKWERES